MPRFHREISQHPLNECSDSKAIFPKIWLNYFDWREHIAAAMAEEVNGRSDKIAEGIRKRSTAIPLCVVGVQGRTCDCGAPLPGTGRLEGAGSPCQARSCPRCSRRRATENVAWLSDAVRALEKGAPRGYGFRHLVFTHQYQPDQDDDVSVDALKDRMSRLWKVWRECWTERLKRKGTGAFVAVEIAGKGHVHMHVLYFGPWIEKEWLVKMAKDNGFVSINEVKGAEGARELCAYPLKSPGRNGKWLKGEAFQVLHPRLAARWEIATFGARLNERYGVFRDIPKTDDDYEIVDEPVKCSCCGRTTLGHEESMGVIFWMRLCDRYGVEPLEEPSEAKTRKKGKDSCQTNQEKEQKPPVTAAPMEEPNPPTQQSLAV